MSKRAVSKSAGPPPEEALFVRLPMPAARKLDRAAEVLGVRKKDLVAGLVSRYVDPDSSSGLQALGGLASRAVSLSAIGPRSAAPRPELERGSYSFQAFVPDGPAEPPPEVLDVRQTAALLQVEEALVVELAETGTLPGRKLGASWRFARAAILAWLAASERAR